MKVALTLTAALALAEMVARGGGRLDAFFLDEGFGSLDEEHLDLAMEGIEPLPTAAQPSSRMSGCPGNTGFAHKT